MLRMFDGHRVLADILEDSPYRVFETLRVAQKAVEAGLLKAVVSQRPKATLARGARDRGVAGRQRDARSGRRAHGGLDSTAPVPASQARGQEEAEAARQDVAVRGRDEAGRRAGSNGHRLGRPGPARRSVPRSVSWRAWCRRSDARGDRAPDARRAARGPRGADGHRQARADLPEGDRARAVGRRARRGDRRVGTRGVGGQGSRAEAAAKAAAEAKADAEAKAAMPTRRPRRMPMRRPLRTEAKAAADAKAGGCRCEGRCR